MHHIGETFSKRYLFSAERIKAVAEVLGDTNPWHHDDEAAATSRFGGLIAAAGHSTGVFVSVIAEHTTRETDALGLRFTHKLKRAVPAGLDAIMTWRVVGMEPVRRLGGDVLRLEGLMTEDDGHVDIEGTCDVLVMPRAVRDAEPGGIG